MIYVFYNNDPLAQDLGGGAEHFRGLFRALDRSGEPFRLVGCRLQRERADPRVVYISEGSNFLRFWLRLWVWFWRNRHVIEPGDVLHFHRNYAAWPKLLLAPRRGRVVVSYHNVTGRVLEGKLGRLARPLRALMLLFERRVVRRADAIVCVSDRDRRELARAVEPGPFARATVIPAGFDARLFAAAPVGPPPPELAGRLLFLGRISHQKNVPLAVSVLERLVAEGGDYTLTIAGDGEDARQLVRRIATSPARERIRWLGRQPHDRVPQLLAEHGILLVTSRYEASPTVVKEALRACRPVVTTDVGDVADWLEEGVTGFVRPAEVEQLADGVRRASALVASGRYRCPDPAALDETAIMDRLLGLYRRLASG
ncbi:MAG: LPS biosynthesis protein [Geminicoccaceae bacterium]|nr:MAG: LPS biosynthesis protein [Geminicoccaceae bacterium]